MHVSHRAAPGRRGTRHVRDLRKLVLDPLGLGDHKANEAEEGDKNTNKDGDNLKLTEQIPTIFWSHLPETFREHPDGKSYLEDHQSDCYEESYLHFFLSVKVRADKRHARLCLSTNLNNSYH